MPSYTILVLICALNVSHADCQPDTAYDVMRGPRVENAQMCGMMGQALVAQTSLAPRDGLEYMKIVCTPSGAKIRAAMHSLEAR